MSNLYAGAGALVFLVLLASFYTRLIQLGLAIIEALQAYATEYNDAYKVVEEPDQDNCEIVKNDVKKVL
jgi:uncharacterized BrkB/YihY/UPF0761 family membrane protein